jgi:hypothetical protein
MTDAPKQPATGSKIPRERIDAARKLWLTGRSSTWCQQQLRERFGVSTRAARRYLEIVRKRLAAEPKPDAESARELAARQLQAAFDAASEKHDAKAMVLAASRLAELHGAIGPQRIEISTKNGAPLGVVLLPVLGEGDATNSG